MVENPTGSESIMRWPEESLEAAWHQAGRWKRVLSDQDLDQAQEEGKQKEGNDR